MRPGDRVRLTMAQRWGDSVAERDATATVVERHPPDTRIELDAPIRFGGALVAYVWVDSADLLVIDNEAKP